MREFSKSLCNIAAKSCHNDRTEWLPFVIHAIDTAGIIKHLFNRWLPEQIRHKTLQVLKYPQECFELSALLHDIGKVTPAFQGKISGSIEGHTELLHRSGLEISHQIENYASKSPHQIAGQAILDEYRFPHEFSVVVGSHHGRGFTRMNQFDSYPDNYFGYKKAQETQWRELWEEWISYSLDKTGFTIETLPKPDVTTQMLMTGLLIMADWIASNTKYFPYISIEDKFEDVDTQARINQAWDKLNLPGILELDTCCNSADIFRDRFVFSPNSVQESVMDFVSQNPYPGLYILEAPMGLGKTEAALSAAEILIKKYGAGGIYFGLPTQATANGIFGRVRDWASKCDTQMHSIRLAHGMTELNQEYKAMFKGEAADSGDENIIVHEWFEGRKQALLADFVIATIDQFLLASLKQKHVMMRHLGLAGKVVILDECHAYDAYMNIYLDHTLTWMGAYNVPVIVLSATLPPQRRIELIKAYLNLNKAPEFRNKAALTSYPVLTYASKEYTTQHVLPSEIDEKHVKIQDIDEDALATYLKDRLRDGGCAAVIVNTVAYAQKLSKMLEAEMNDFRIVCFHSRFVATDRAEIERDLLKNVGKTSSSETRNNLVVVGTQVIEQSLDLDFDTMITELCPMDLLLQRAGRLHRHRRTRPGSCDKPVLAILHPSEQKRNRIYSAWILEQTQKYLPEELSIPSCIPILVGKVYERPDEQTESYKKYQYDIEVKKHNAEKFCIRSNMLKQHSKNLLTHFINDEAGNSTEAEASVRDTEDTIETLVLARDKNVATCYKLISGEAAFDTTMNLSDSEALLVARERIRLPMFFGNWNDIENELAKMPPRWKDAKLLKGESLLLLDSNLELEICGRKLCYSKDFGLEIITAKE